MSSRSRVLSFVAVAALAAAAAVVFGVVATRGHVPAAAKPHSGHPPLDLALGDRADAEAQALNKAQRLYAAKDYAQAATIFGRYRSLEAQVGSALAAWPSGTVERLQNLQSAHRRSSLVALHLGLAYYWERRNADALEARRASLAPLHLGRACCGERRRAGPLEAWRAGSRQQPDTPSAVRAGDFLHP